MLSGPAVCGKSYLRGCVTPFLLPVEPSDGRGPDVVRGIVVIDEAIRRWAEILGRNFSSSLRLRALRFADKLNLDKVGVIISDVAQLRLPREIGH
jgi:hypothetical protein